MEFILIRVRANEDSTLESFALTLIDFGIKRYTVSRAGLSKFAFVQATHIPTQMQLFGAASISITWCTWHEVGLGWGLQCRHGSGHDHGSLGIMSQELDFAYVNKNLRYNHVHIRSNR